MPKTKVKLWDYSKAVFQVIHSHENNSDLKKQKTKWTLYESSSKALYKHFSISGYHDRGFQ